MLFIKVERLMAHSNEFVPVEEMAKGELEVNDESISVREPSFTQDFISKSRIGMDLIRMNVKVFKTNNFYFELI